MMKKILMMLSLFTLVLAACSSKDNGKEKPAKLVVSTWGFADDFFRPEVYEPFEKKHNVEIVVDSGNNADRLNKVRQANSDVDYLFIRLLCTAGHR